MKFPVRYQRVAKAIYEKLEGQNWGADEVEAEDPGEGDETIAAPGDASDNDRIQPSWANSAPHTERRVNPGLSYSDFPDDSDPIYGLNGIMHHILRIRGPKMVSYQIDPSYTTRDAKRFGDNGCQVGQCWPTQMALLRDGAHGMYPLPLSHSSLPVSLLISATSNMPLGQRMGGISGTAIEGTYSIVVSGMYGGLDQDYGATLYYSGSNSHDNKSSTPITSNKTKALERSIVTRNAVRVFRSYASHWSGRPRAGLRYDGLYDVKGMSIETNEVGGAYKRFKLERRENQPPINTNEPSSALVSQFERVKHGYTRTRQRRIPVASASIS
jgi:hypothetical protein